MKQEKEFYREFSSNRSEISYDKALSPLPPLKETMNSNHLGADSSRLKTIKLTSNKCSSCTK